MVNKERVQPASGWQTVDRPGFLGEHKDDYVSLWNERYGEDNWRLAWELTNGEILEYFDMFYQVFVAGYVQRFRLYPDEAIYITSNYSYCYDQDFLTQGDTFNPRALYNCLGRPNQQHAVAINIALEKFLGLTFQGRHPLQVRENYESVNSRQQPAGYKWSPGRVEAVRPDLIPRIELPIIWWQRGSIADMYQKAKILQIKPA